MRRDCRRRARGGAERGAPGSRLPGSPARATARSKRKRPQIRRPPSRSACALTNFWLTPSTVAVVATSASPVVAGWAAASRSTMSSAVRSAMYSISCGDSVISAPRRARLRLLRRPLCRYLRYPQHLQHPQHPSIGGRFRVAFRSRAPNGRSSSALIASSNSTVAIAECPLIAALAADSRSTPRLTSSAASSAHSASAASRARAGQAPPARSAIANSGSHASAARSLRFSGSVGSASLSSPV